MIVSIILDRAGAYARTSLACRCRRCRLVWRRSLRPRRRRVSRDQPIAPISRIIWAIRLVSCRLPLYRTYITRRLPVNLSWRYLFIFALWSHNLFRSVGIWCDFRLIRAAKTSDQLRAKPEYRSVKNDNILQGSQLGSRGKGVKSCRDTFYEMPTLWKFLERGDFQKFNTAV